VGNPEPRDAFQAKFSVQFGTALILTGRSGGYEDYSAQTLQDLQIRELMAKTTLRVDPHQEARGIRVNMKMKNGRSFTESIICPTLEPDEVRSKFRSISSKTLGEGVGSMLEKLVGGLEQLDNLEPVSGLLVQVKS